jgi:hypothetical protein
MLPLLVLTTVVAAVRGLWSPCGLSMLSSLNPVAERARGNRFSLTALWYVVGAGVGGALLGGVCAAGAALVAAVGLPSSGRFAVAAVCAVLAVASDLRVGGWSLPTFPRQVDERWLTTYRRWIYASGYGVQIGTGFATYIMTAGVYLLPVLAALTGQPGVAFLAGVGFGVVRGCTIALAGFARDPLRLQSLMATVDRLAPWSLRFAALSSAVVAVVAVARAGGVVPASLVTAALVVGFVAPSLTGRRAHRASTA